MAHTNHQPINNLDDMVARLKPFALPGKKTEFVLTGGAALFLHQLRQTIHDVDVYTPEESAYQKSLLNLDPLVDITANPFMWGQIRISDASKARVVYEDDTICLKLLDLATLFIQKTDAARDQDIRDVELMSREIPNPMDIIQRMAELKKGNQYTDWYMATENLLAELQAQYMMDITNEMIAATTMDPEDQVLLAASFGLHLQQESSVRVKAPAH